jgi:hypothetical protein
VLPYIRAGPRRRRLSGREVFHGFSQMGAMRDAAVAACQPFDFVLSPVTAPVPSLPGRVGQPDQRPGAPLEHIAFTLPFNMSEQPAASVDAATHAAGCRSACRSPAAATTTWACCGWRAPGSGCAAASGPGRCRRADRARAVRRRQGRGGAARAARCIPRPVDAGNPCGSGEAARATRPSSALWRMMSFYDTPLADLDAPSPPTPAGPCRT